VDKVDSGPSVTKDGMSVAGAGYKSRELRLSPPDHCDHAIDRRVANSSGARSGRGESRALCNVRFGDALWAGCIGCEEYGLELVYSTVDMFLDEI
jgi:hypothetical protein